MQRPLTLRLAAVLQAPVVARQAIKKPSDGAPSAMNSSVGAAQNGGPSAARAGGKEGRKLDGRQERDADDRPCARCPAFGCVAELAVPAQHRALHLRAKHRVTLQHPVQGARLEHHSLHLSQRSHAVGGNLSNGAAARAVAAALLRIAPLRDKGGVSASRQCAGLVRACRVARTAALLFPRLLGSPTKSPSLTVDTITVVVARGLWGSRFKPQQLL